MKLQRKSPPQRGGLGCAQSPTPHDGYPFSRTKLKNGWVALGFQQTPTALLTITVKEPKLQKSRYSTRWQIRDFELLTYANKLIHWTNADVFGRNYKKRGLGLTGFGCLEYQSNLQPHLHLAIANSMSPSLFDQLSEAIFNKCKKIPIFHRAGIDWVRIEESPEDHLRVAKYLAKEGDMLILGPNGIIA